MKNKEVIDCINTHVANRLKSKNERYPKYAYTYKYSSYSFEEFKKYCDKQDQLLKKAVQKIEFQKKLGGCFIATAATGDYNHPVVIDLRMFRDNWLLKREWGIKFTNWYYTYGPKAARVIEKSTLLKKVTFILIVKPLQVITKKFI